MEMESCPQLVRKDDSRTWVKNEKERNEVSGASNNTWGSVTRTDAEECNEEREKEAKTNNTDIGTIVSKSKKAASTLWTLLHARNCRLGVNRCAQTGCAEAKLLYLHMKICAAGPGAACPTRHKGCNDARKLLTHYRKCREIRARQAGQYPKTQQHACLVCTLVARHAKSMFDVTPSPVQRRPNRKHTITSMSNALDGRLSFQSPASGYSMLPSPPPNSPTNDGNVAAFVESPEVMQDKFGGDPRIMPPPIPRFAGAKSQKVNFIDGNVHISSLNERFSSPIPPLNTTRPRSDSLPAPQLYSEDYTALVQEERDQSSQRAHQQCQQNGRRRSLSCGGISALGGTSPLGCETIHEEEPPASICDGDFDDILNDC